LRLKAYIIGGDPERWAKADSEAMLQWVVKLESLGPDWINAIGALRTQLSLESWESLKRLSERSAIQFLALLPPPSQQTGRLNREDIETLVAEVLARAQSPSPSFLTRLQSTFSREAPNEELLTNALFLIARLVRGLPAESSHLDSTVRSLFLQLAFRSLPSILGASLTDPEIARSQLFQSAPQGLSPERTESNADGGTEDYQNRMRTKHLAFFARAATDSISELISLDGTPIQWQEFNSVLEGRLNSNQLQKFHEWAPLTKTLIVGGAPQSLSREEIKNAFALAGNIIGAISRRSIERWRPQVIISAFTQGWEKIREQNQRGSPLSATGFPQPFSDRKIVDAIQKLEGLDPEYQLPPSLSQSLPQALRLARSALEGPVLGSEITWDRWLSLLRLASILDGPIFDSGTQLDRRLSLITRMLDRVIETTKCVSECIPTIELYAFFKEELQDSPLSTFSQFKIAKELALGGSPDFITLQNLRDLKTTLTDLTPAFKVFLSKTAPIALGEVAQHIEPLMQAILRVHPDGIPLPLFNQFFTSFEASLGVPGIRNEGEEQESEFPPLAQLLVETLSGTRLQQRAEIPAASWQTTARKLRELSAALGPIATRADFEEYIRRAIDEPEAWAPLRTWIQSIPAAHPRGVLSWRILDAWIAQGVARGIIDVDASAQELSDLSRPIIRSMHRNGALRAVGIQTVALQRLLDTVAHLAGPIRAILRTIKSHSELVESDPAQAWERAELELVRLQQTLNRMRGLYPLGIGIPLSEAAALVDRLPRAWFTLDRGLIKNGLEPIFNRLWLCSSEEAFCPSGLVTLLNQVRTHLRAEKLSAQFIELYPQYRTSGPGAQWLRAAMRFGQNLSLESDRRIWQQWKTVAEVYPQLFQGDHEQALFVPTSLIHTSNTRVHFHFDRFSDFFMRAYDSTHASTPEGAAPIRLPEFIAMADDFDDLAKAFRALESRTPSMAATRFREAGLFSSHGDGNDELTVREFTGYLVLIWSAKSLVRRVVDRLTPECPLAVERLDLLGRPYIDMPCFRRGFTQTYRDALLENLPGLLRDWRTWGESQIRNYIDALERTGRERGTGNDPIPINDMDGIASLLQYMESLMLRFDTDRDQLLDQSEIHDMFPYVKAVIAAAVRKQGSDSIAEDDAMLESLFTWVLTRKRLPAGPIPFGFLAWHMTRESRQFTIGRYDAMIAISVLLKVETE
jgi:hypothetical protein